MTPSRRRALVAVALMLAAFVGAAVWRPTIHLTDQQAKMELERVFPRSFGEWTMDDRMPVQLVSPDIQQVLDKIYNQTLSRTYVHRSGVRMMLSVAYGGDQSDATRAHRPEICYPAQGFQIIDSRTGSIALDHGALPVQRLVAKAGGRTEPITYWLTVGERVAISGTQQKLAQLSYGVRGVIADGMLVRVSSIDNDAPNAFTQQAEFVDALLKAVAPGFKSRVAGPAA